MRAHFLLYDKGIYSHLERSSLTSFSGREKSTGRETGNETSTREGTRQARIGEKSSSKLGFQYSPCFLVNIASEGRLKELQGELKMKSHREKSKIT